MSDVFEEAVRLTHLRFPGSNWDILTPHEKADAIWAEIHRIDTSGELRRVAVPKQADEKLEHTANPVVARRRRKAA